MRSVREVPGRGQSVSFAVGGVVLRDDEDLIVTASISGSEKAQRAGPRTGPGNRCLADAEWDGSYALGIWDGDAVVRLHQPGTCWSIWRFVEGRRWSRLWYGNLESPWVRTPMGYDTQDWTLDVVAEGVPGEPDWTVSLKDEDELDWYTQHGMRSAEESAVIRAKGAELAEVLRTLEPSEDAAWDRWIPPGDARAVALAEGWSTRGL